MSHRARRGRRCAAYGQCGRRPDGFSGSVALRGTASSGNTQESETVVFNVPSISVSMTDTLALRTSVLTEFHTDPADNSKSTDNTFGVSLVYSFN